jgi:TRAP-type uncharacterized transport system substrate-binding protein
MKTKLWAAAALATTLAFAGTAQAQQFFRIGTGGTAGTYYPVGGMIANAVSQPGKIIATAQSSNGSLAASRSPTSPPGPTPAPARSRGSPRSPTFG